MQPLSLFAATALALTAAACGPKTPPVRASLDCPLTQGDLSRTAASPDGKACTYAADDGAQVTLRLVALTGGLDATLSGIETTLLANREAPAKPGPTTGAPSASATTGTGGDAARTVGEAEADAAGVAPQAGKARDGNGGDDDDAVDIEMQDGQAVVRESEDGTTRVNLPGIHIVANEANESAKVQVGPIHIDAGGDAATIRIRRDVRLRGEALNPDKRGVRATFIYTGKDLPDGYSYVGYEAGGPKAGPITVAVVKSKAGHDADNVASDVRKLVRRNGGV